MTDEKNMGSFDEPAFPESGGDMLARLGTDGQAWAREFCLRFSNAAVVFDEQLMLGWFANAIEAGRTAGMAAEQAVQDAEIRAVYSKLHQIRAVLDEGVEA